MDTNNTIGTIENSEELKSIEKEVSARLKRSGIKKSVKKTKRSSYKGKVLAVMFIGIMSIMLVGLSGTKLILSFKDFNEKISVKTRPFKLGVQTPAIWLEEREKEIVSPLAEERKLEEVEVSELVKNSDNPEIAQKIVDKFGDHAPLALSIATAESHLRVDAIGVNTNGTTDIGVFQINYQTHKGKPECSLDKISTVDGNINCAYVIFKAQGNFTAWSAFMNGKYLAFYK